MPISLFDHQKDALERIKTGSILVGRTGSGKTLTALAYFYTKVLGGSLMINGESNWSKPKIKKDLYIITTARKRDSGDWIKEASDVLVDVTKVDSWNNVHKYTHIQNAFFIFDEQRIVGSGLWVKSFLKIAKRNNWILLTATPGDNWIDYIPVFIANGFYTNRTEFITRHVVYKRFVKFPVVERYLELTRLIKLRDSILIPMISKKKTISHNIDVYCDYDKEMFKCAQIRRWNPFTDEPVKDIGALCYLMRRIVNSHRDRIVKLQSIYDTKRKVIVFYNFDYELTALEQWCIKQHIPYSQWNGHKHEELLKGDSWIYLVQYTAGAEAWNCIETDTMVFFSQNYSYKIMIQAAGRIDRINTKFIDLYYYHFLSYSLIDVGIRRALNNKENFNEYNYFKI